MCGAGSANLVRWYQAVATPKVGLLASGHRPCTLCSGFSTRYIRRLQHRVDRVLVLAGICACIRACVAAKYATRTIHVRPLDFLGISRLLLLPLRLFARARSTEYHVDLLRRQVQGSSAKSL